MQTWSCSKGKSQRITAWAILFVAVYPIMHVSKLSELFQSGVPSNSLILIPKEFGTVFERLERLEEQDWFSPVYPGRLEYICWNSFYPPRCIDALFGVRIQFRSLVQRLIWAAFTLGARALVPEHRHKLVLCSDTGYPRYLIKRCPL